MAKGRKKCRKRKKVVTFVFLVRFQAKQQKGITTMKTNNNITALKDEELDNVNGGIVVATVAVGVMGGAILGTAAALFTKYFVALGKELKADKKAKKEKAAE